MNDAEGYPVVSGSEKVGDSEYLARVLEDPSHVDGLLEFTKGAFVEASQRGVSVQRYSMTTDESIHRFGFNKVALHNERYPEKKRIYAGYAIALCSSFREAEYPEGQRLFGVFATPMEDVPSHADIFVVVSPSKVQKAFIQNVFFEAFSQKTAAPET
ncbi:hypothetical protein [Pseudomonas sp. DWP3-1-2]|uniref:hypothetical protein n=1 Tax=Pseudomonas sp. DWP3-1-2 TaxID=2804645 RepID=UPI003CEB4E58